MYECISIHRKTDVCQRKRRRYSERRRSILKRKQTTHEREREREREREPTYKDRQRPTKCRYIRNQIQA